MLMNATRQTHETATEEREYRGERIDQVLADSFPASTRLRGVWRTVGSLNAHGKRRSAEEASG